MTRQLLPLFVAILIVAVSCSPHTSRDPVTMRVAVTSSTAPLVDDLLAAYRRLAPQVSFEFTYGNAETLYMALAEDSVDWGLVAYLPADSDLWSAPVGSDALAVVVHPQNELTGLTRGQVRAIYLGHALTWEEFGGPGSAIVVVAREPGSAARGAFDELVMGDLPTTSAARLATSSEALLTIVDQEPGAIGYGSLALVDARVRPLAIDGVTPSQESTRSGSYPLASVIRFVSREEPSGAAGDFLSWLLSDEGQAVVAQRYTPLVR